mmetsp:Transcript_2875/g.7507  ORF Transcript_2875/g.7507 Transcript_2875/m.7507 type:complete len:90 (+) Transcript_2875:1294-1563(+)
MQSHLLKKGTKKEEHEDLHIEADHDPCVAVHWGVESQTHERPEDLVKNSGHFKAYFGPVIERKGKEEAQRQGFVDAAVLREQHHPPHGN